MDEYGIFTDEGCIESGFYSREEAAAAIAKRYPNENGAEVHALCSEHEEQPADHCEDCNSEEE